MSTKSSNRRTILGDRSPDTFLHEFWQKKPLLIRGAFPDFESPITPEELAGLALEEDAEARLILERGGDYPWQLRQGPFDEEDFQTLPESHWTLLVQEVDQWVPEIAKLIDHFNFIPRWRIDDVMVSYAPDRGNVGAHIDNYDVFLIQAAGQREWRIGSQPILEERLVQDIDVSMLADFDPDETWTLNPGDMLYLPPRIPHHGIAMGDCMTFSVGFRAPSHEELLAALLGKAIDAVDPHARYSDPDLRPREDPGLISAEDLARVRTVLDEFMTDRNLLRSFGTLVTEPKRSEYLLPAEHDWTEDDLLEEIASGAVIDRIDPNRMAYAEEPGVTRADGGILLFAHGEIVPVANTAAFAGPLLAGTAPLDADTLEEHLSNREFVALLTRLVNAGHLVVTSEG